MKTLILVRGAPGSGKTTYAKSFNEYTHIETDTYFVRPDGTYDWNRSLLPNAHKWCQGMVSAYMKDGAENIVVSNTFTRLWELDPYLNMAKEQGYSVVIKKATGEWENVHGVHWYKVDFMRKNYEPHPDETDIEFAPNGEHQE